MDETETAVKKNSAPSIIAFILAFSLAYTVVRYHIVGPVPWKDFPFFILNKAVSLAAFILISLNFGLGPLNNLGIRVSEGWLNARKVVGMTGFLLAVIHAFISFLIFKPAIYGKFFQSDGTLTLIGGLSMLGGVLAFVVLWGYNMSFQTHLRDEKAFIRFITSRTFLLYALTLGGVHLFFMGYEGWLAPEGWHGGMPPISLVGFSVGLAMYVVNLLGRK